MKREYAFVQMGLAALSLVLWLVLPVFSFTIIVQLYGITGWNLAMNINQVMLISAGLSVLMLIAAAMRNRNMMIITSVLQAILAILTIVLRKNILLEGNLKWIYTTAQLLISAVPDLEISGAQVNAENLRNVVKLLSDNYMQMGLGFILHAACIMAYVVIAFIAPSEPISNNKGMEWTSNPVISQEKKANTSHWS